jgi:Putative GTPase activating protein for Arf
MQSSSILYRAAFELEGLRGDHNDANTCSSLLSCHVVLHHDDIRKKRKSTSNDRTATKCLLSSSFTTSTSSRRTRLSSGSLSSSPTRATTSSSLSSLSSASFPPYCRQLLGSIAGNDRCVDCGSRNPEWASVTYGTLLCMRCCGRHRSYGVQTSYTKSLDMDSWSLPQILAMLEGGNEQIQQFFARHYLGRTMTSVEDNNENCIIHTHIQNRYHTKAAKFYKHHLAKHTEYVRTKGLYQGREANRPSTTTSSSSASSLPNEHCYEERKRESNLPIPSYDKNERTNSYSAEEQYSSMMMDDRHHPSSLSSSESSMCTVIA